MSYGEAYRLVTVLASDPSSQLAAALGKWDRPVDATALVLMDLYDLTHHIAWAQGGRKGKAPKPYPRPWPDQTTTRTKPSLSQDDVIAALRLAGHTAPLPMKEG